MSRLFTKKTLLFATLILLPIITFFLVRAFSAPSTTDTQPTEFFTTTTPPAPALVPEATRLFPAAPLPPPDVIPADPSLRATVALARDNFARERQDLLENDALLEDAPLWDFLRSDFPHHVFYIKKTNARATAPFLSFKLDCFGCSGNPIVIMVAQTDTGFTPVLYNYEAMSYNQALDCDALQTMGVTAQALQGYLELDSTWRGPASLYADFSGCSNLP